MPLFQYIALSQEGKRITGLIDADTIDDAKLRLLKKRIMVTKVHPLTGHQAICNLSVSDVLLLTRELSKLLHAGMPLFESLLALEEKYRGHKSHRLFLDLCDQVKSGIPLSQALSKHPKAFDALYCSMVANAEKTGTLNKALEELILLLERQTSLKRQLVAATLYPAILTGFCLFVLSALLFFVVPSLFELFEGRKLHPFTQIVLNTSKWANEMKFFLFLFILGLIGLVSAAFTSSTGKNFLMKLSAHIPFVKTLWMKSSLIRFCRAASSLLDGGVPLLQSLKLSRKMIRHPQLHATLLKAEKHVLEGGKFSEEFKSDPTFPTLVPRMLAIAEEGGNLSQMLQHIAQIYEEEVEKHLSQITTILQPVLLLILGAIVGFVLLSVLLPLTDVSSFISES